MDNQSQFDNEIDNETSDGNDITSSSTSHEQVQQNQLEPQVNGAPEYLQGENKPELSKNPLNPKETSADQSPELKQGNKQQGDPSIRAGAWNPNNGPRIAPDKHIQKTQNIDTNADTRRMQNNLE